MNPAGDYSGILGAKGISASEKNTKTTMITRYPLINPSSTEVTLSLWINGVIAEIVHSDWVLSFTQFDFSCSEIFDPVRQKSLLRYLTEPIQLL